MYLDEVSVHSILASRKGGIATQFTDNQKASTTSDVGRSAGIGLGSTKAKMDTSSRTVEAKSSQVLSKAVIQTSFKELYELERESLTMVPIEDTTAPEPAPPYDFARMFEMEDSGRPWLFDPASLGRGDLIEVKLALEADPIFHMVSVFATVMDLFEDNEHLLGDDVAAQLPQVRSLVRVLEGLLAGLVPIRGRLVEYKCAMIGDREVLIHQKLLNQMETDDLCGLRPVYVVGVAERDLFWKDIRRVLFSGAEYTAFCRVATKGLANKWHPVKVANVLGGIVPNFDELMVDLSERARTTMAAAGVSDTTAFDGDQQPSNRIPLRYAELLAGHHGRPLTPQMRDTITQVTPRTRDWLGSVDKRRPVFAEVTRAVETALGVESPADGETRLKCREVALNEAGFVGSLRVEGDGVSRRARGLTNDRDDVFLDTEIIAIYW